MTDDLLKELDAFCHDLQEFKEKWQDDDIWSVLDQAADKIEIYAIRIETLEAALREIADGPRDVDKSYISLFHEIQSEARKALEGKDD
jgi:hypothetical protein